MSSPPNKAKESELSNSHESETAAKIYYKKPTNDLKRVIGIDFSRGWGMFIVIVTHLFNFWGLGFLSLAEESPSSARPLLQTILSFPFLWQATWTSAFAFFSGAGILFTLHYHIHDKKMDVKKRLKKSSMNFVVLFIVNFIYVYLSIYPIYDINYIRQRGLIPGSLSAGTFTPPRYYDIFYCKSAHDDFIFGYFSYFGVRNHVEKWSRSV